MYIALTRCSQRLTLMMNQAQWTKAHGGGGPLGTKTMHIVSPFIGREVPQYAAQLWAEDGG